jgi:hypothetical protein
MHVACSIAVCAIAAVMLVAPGAGAWAQEPPAKLGADNEAEVILKDSKKSDRETAAEVAKCMKQWGPQTQMTKEEWATSCRSTLHYFPESR